MPKEEKNIAYLSFEVSQNPRTTLASLQAEVCRFVNEMQDFYAKSDKDVAKVYSLGLMIHSSLGMAIARKSSNMLMEVAEFMQKVSLDNLEGAIEEALELRKETRKEG